MNAESENVGKEMDRRIETAIKQENWKIRDARREILVLRELRGKIPVRGEWGYVKEVDRPDFSIWIVTRAKGETLEPDQEEPALMEWTKEHGWRGLIGGRIWRGTGPLLVWKEVK